MMKCLIAAFATGRPGSFCLPIMHNLGCPIFFYALRAVASMLLVLHLHRARQLL